jgi:hypothetical protein
LNLGAGIIHQKDAMWMLKNGVDTVSSDMTLYGVDVFTEIPLTDRHNTITFYGAWSDYQMGTNFIRNLGVMNPANGVAAGQSLAGGGNAMPLIGTGQTIYTQLGYKFKDNLLPENGSIQVYADMQYSTYQYLKDPMVMYEGGVNWLIHGTHGAKLTLGMQNRPVFQNVLGDNREAARKNMFILQYQISL